MDAIVPMEVVKSRIYLIRGQKVLLDRDLAEMYGVETRVLNQAVRRNLDRFSASSAESVGRFNWLFRQGGTPQA